MRQNNCCWHHDGIDWTHLKMKRRQNLPCRHDLRALGNAVPSSSSVCKREGACHSLGGWRRWRIYSRHLMPWPRIVEPLIAVFVVIFLMSLSLSNSNLFLWWQWWCWIPALVGRGGPRGRESSHHQIRYIFQLVMKNVRLCSEMICWLSFSFLFRDRKPSSLRLYHTSDERHFMGHCKIPTLPYRSPYLPMKQARNNSFA